MNNGDFVRIEYTGKVKDTGEIFDTTDESLAKENGIRNSNTRYGPVTIILGAGYVLPGLDKRLAAMEPNTSSRFDIPPEEAFGNRDPKLIQLMSLAHFRNQKIAPVPGQYISLGNNISGKIMSVSSGRVRIDFNNPLSGKVLEYEVKNLGIAVDQKEKVNAVVDFYLGSLAKAANITVFGEKAEIEIPDKILRFVSGRVRDKISGDVKKYIMGITEVLFLEKKDAEKKEPEKKDA